VRKGIKQCIAELSDMTVMEEAGSAHEVFDFFNRSRCDVLVLGITLSDLNGLEILRIMKQAHPDVAVLAMLILAGCPEDECAAHCLRAGAAGIFSKSCAPDELPVAIRKIARGGRYVPPALAETLVFEKTAASPAAPVTPHKALSGREFQIFCQLATGRAQKAIAAGLGLSAKTISTHRFRMLRKMRMNSNADIVRYALTHQLVS
jgi:DNA-binding NarL/FixJ family response regulator